MYIKFVGGADGSELLVETSSYKIYEENEHGIRHVIINYVRGSDLGSEPVEITLSSLKTKQIDNEEKDYTGVFVMNDKGETIDRIFT